MPLPIVYRAGSDMSASYDWVDYVSGAGYRRFYGTSILNSAGTKSYYLNNRTTDSASGFLDGGGALTPVFYTEAAAAGGDLDIDFDITFNVPAYIASADAFFNVSTALTDNIGCRATVTITVYHVSTGAVETSLGTVTGYEQLAGGAVPRYVRENYKITLTGKTFGVGEKLRVSVAVANSQANGKVRLYHDPNSGVTLTDIGSRTINTDLTADIPFRLDI